MADVYGFDAKYQGVGLVTAKNMKLVVSGGGDTTNAVGEYLVQNVSISYQQPVQILRELSTSNAYYHTMPPQGSLQIGRIVGQKPITSLLGAPGQGIWKCPEKGEDANASGRVVTLSPISNTGSVGGPTYKMYGCIVESFGNTTDANSSFVQEQVSIRFGMMEVS